MPPAFATPACARMAVKVRSRERAGVVRRGDDEVGRAPRGADELVEGVADRPAEQQDAEDHPDAERDRQRREAGAQRAGAHLAERELVEGPDHGLLPRAPRRCRRRRPAPARRASARRELHDVVRRAAGDLAGDAPVAQEDHAIGDRRGRRVVGDHDDVRPSASLQLAQQREDLAPARESRLPVGSSASRSSGRAGARGRSRRAAARRRRARAGVCSARSARPTRASSATRASRSVRVARRAISAGR